MPHVSSTPFQVPDKHHIPQTKGHSWLFGNLASIAALKLEDSMGSTPMGGLHAPPPKLICSTANLPLRISSSCENTTRVERKGCEFG